MPRLYALCSFYLSHSVYLAISHVYTYWQWWKYRALSSVSSWLCPHLVALLETIMIFNQLCCVGLHNHKWHDKGPQKLIWNYFLLVIAHYIPGNLGTTQSTSNSLLLRTPSSLCLGGSPASSRTPPSASQWYLNSVNEVNNIYFSCKLVVT